MWKYFCFHSALQCNSHFFCSLTLLFFKEMWRKPAVLTNEILFPTLPRAVPFLWCNSTDIICSIHILTLYGMKCTRGNQLSDLPKESKDKNLKPFEEISQLLSYSSVNVLPWTFPLNLLKCWGKNSLPRYLANDESAWVTKFKADYFS